jgi:AcrR family transcriptional regulator
MATARGEARRKQILDGALAAIREHPIGDVELAAIAARAGMRPSHVLYYFPSRDAVLVAAAEHAEQELAEDRGERLRAIASADDRLAAYVTAYLPDDRRDPVWKLWMEGWLRSVSREEFGEVGRRATAGWHRDLTDVVRYAIAPRAWSAEEVATFARRFTFLLDGVAVHVLAGHLTSAQGAEVALGALRSELRVGA